MPYDLIIIGGGPAGISAGIYAARKKLKTLIITKDFFGQAGRAYLVENYLGFKGLAGRKLMEIFKEHLDEYQVETREDEEARGVSKEGDIFEIETSKNRYQARAVIVASGRNPRPLMVPGEKEFLGRGVSYCVTCDGPLFANKTVAVIGGGNSGFAAALELSKYCPRVYILEAGSRVMADEIFQERAKETGKVEAMTEVTVKEIKGKELVGELFFEERKTQTLKNLKVEGVFIEIGSIPATSFINNLVDFNEKGDIKADPKTCTTKTPGLFAAGDVTDVLYKQIIIAAAEGAKATLSAYQYLQK